ERVDRIPIHGAERGQSGNSRGGILLGGLKNDRPVGAFKGSGARPHGGRVRGGTFGRHRWQVSAQAPRVASKRNATGPAPAGGRAATVRFAKVFSVDATTTTVVLPG